MSRPASPRPRTRNYRVIVQDFGPIERARIDIRPLTVLIGPSNTGKSYFAVLLYALHQCFSQARRSADDGETYRPRFLLQSLMPHSFEIGSELREHLRLWARGLSEGDPASDLPAPANRAIQSVLANDQRLCGLFADHLHRSFGVHATGDLIRRSDSDPSSAELRARVDLIVPQNGGEAVRYGFAFGSRENHALSGEFPLPAVRRPRQELFSSLARDLTRTGEVSTYRTLLSDASRRSFKDALGPVSRYAYYLPAARTGIMLSHRVVARGLVQHAAATMEEAIGPPLLPGVLADFMSHLIDIGAEAATPDWGNVHDDLAATFEKELLNGTIRVRGSGANDPSFSYQPAGWRHELPLRQASAMVSELAPVALHLRYLVEPGEVLIVEEPEAHLHPAMQAAFAREVARLVRSGVRLVLTTHSDWFLDQISNLVRLSALPDDDRVRNGDVALSPRDVGAWLFKPGLPSGGSVVEEVLFDDETGLYPSDYDSVSEVLYNEGAAIFNRLRQIREDRQK